MERMMKKRSSMTSGMTSDSSGMNGRRTVGMNGSRAAGMMVMAGKKAGMAILRAIPIASGSRVHGSGMRAFRV